MNDIHWDPKTTFWRLMSLWFRCATGEAWPSIMLSCAPPKPCDPRTNMNRTILIHRDYYAQALSSSSFNRIVIDTNASSTVDLHDFTPPKVLASSGKLAEKQEENVGEYLNLLYFGIIKNFQATIFIWLEFKFISFSLQWWKEEIVDQILLTPILSPSSSYVLFLCLTCS